MPVFSIQDFKAGLDLRKMYATAPAGSLRTLRNAFINAGAEIEKRSIFLDWGPAPPGSLGLVALNEGPFVVVNGPAGLTGWSGAAPNGVIGQVSIPFQTAFDRVADWEVFNGALYLVMHGTDGRYYHYYNQVYVADPMATASSVRTYGSKMYGVDGRLLRFSAINDPTSWTPPTGTTNDGSGYIDLSSQDADSGSLVSIEVYLGNLAIFSTLSCQIWKVDPDPSLNNFVQLLRNTGLLCAAGLVQFGQDVLYLSSHGVRSLRVQNISLTAGTTDIGTPIDEPFRQLLLEHGPDWFAGARCRIQPRTGRVFIFLPDRAYVLSAFQQPAITAWSQFDAPFGFADAAVADPWMAIRGDDGRIYLYGNDVLQQYDDTEAEVITPALACDSPSKTKLFHSFDVGGEGTWTLSVGCDPNNQATEETVATFTGSTYINPTMTMPEASTHISLRFRSTDPTRCKLGQVNVLFSDGSET